MVIFRFRAGKMEMTCKEDELMGPTEMQKTAKMLRKKIMNPKISNGMELSLSEHNANALHCPPLKDAPLKLTWFKKLH